MRMHIWYRLAALYKEDRDLQYFLYVTLNNNGETVQQDGTL